MHDIDIDFKEVDRQIDFHLSAIPQKALPPHFDYDDFRQDIYVELLDRTAIYKPESASRKTYFDRIIKFHIKSHLGTLRWKKNRSEQRISGEDFDCIPLLNDVKHGELNMAERNVFSQEVWNVVEQMPDEEREYCELLMHYRLHQVARIKKVSRQTVFRKMQKIKPYFLKAGLKPGNFIEN